MYNSSFYGCMLWYLKGEKTKQLVNSWSVSVREMCDLPHRTTRGPSCSDSYICKVYWFHPVHQKMQEKSSNSFVDLTTMTGQKLDEASQVDIFKINRNKFKRTFKFDEMPAEEEWKVDLVMDHSVLSLDTSDNLTAFTQAELNEMRDYVATC